MTGTIAVELPFGEETLTVGSLPSERTTIVEPTAIPRADAVTELVCALRHPVAGRPLRDVARKGGTVAISVCDGTRPQPRHIVLPAILDELDGLVRAEDIVILVATGTHRANTHAELRAMLGSDIADRVAVKNHDARDDSELMWIGRLGADVPVWLNQSWVDADIRITTGFVEPHFFAGFSGGPKMVAPGLAGLETTLTLHDASRIGHPNARWGMTDGNPVHDDIRAIASSTGTDYSLDVILDAEKNISRAFGGELLPMHREACAAARAASMLEVDKPFDVVLTTNSGFPLDQNLYQAVKGMSAAAQVVKPGGTIICAAECRDGFPDHGGYREQLTRSSSPKALLDEISQRHTTIPDQWQLQIQAKIQMHARVVMHTAFLSDDELAAAHLEQTSDIERTVLEALASAGNDSRLCVLPHGPLTVPFVGQRA
jgi:nickel-dependent lactate racemase